jgi:hypothetical protein
LLPVSTSRRGDGGVCCVGSSAIAVDIVYLAAGLSLK